jgi:pimeloyl-ACP methyl ester carboxylesterase
MQPFYLDDVDAFVRYVELPGSDPPNVFLHGIGRSSVTLAHIAAHERLRPSRALLCRTARSLVDLTQPTTREQLVDLDLPRSFIVGARTLEADVKPPSGEAGEGLEATDVRVIVVPDAGHPMMFQNPDGFASAIAAALDPL